MVIGKNDKLLYKFSIENDLNHLHMFILYSSLDKLDILSRSNPNYYLKDLENDKNSFYVIYGYITGYETKFLLLWDKKLDIKEDKIRSFYYNVHYFYSNLWMNPFYEINTNIDNKTFIYNIKKWMEDIIK